MSQNNIHALLFAGVTLVTGIAAAISVLGFRVPENVDVIDGDFAKAFEQHYEEHFPAKKFGVNLWAFIDYTVFGEGRPGVVVGKENWLYTDEEFNVSDTAAKALQANLAQITNVRKQLADAGVSLVVTVVPAKARIYPEYLEDRLPAPVHATLYDQALATLSSAHIPTADLRHPLSAGKTLQHTYLRTDTHWTPWGAQLAALEVARVARDAGLLRTPASRYVTSLTRVSDHRGDLLNFLPLDPWFSYFLPPREELRVMKTEAAVSVVQTSSESDLFGDSALPQVVLIGTSYSANPLWNFTGYLKEALGEDLASYAREGAGPFKPMSTYLASPDYRQQPPRLVIWEIPERSLLANP